MNYIHTLSVSTTIFLPSLSHSQDNGLLLIVEWSNYCHVLCPGCTVGAAGILLTVVLTETRDTAHCWNHHTPVRCGRAVVSHSQTPPWTTLSCTVGTRSKYFSVWLHYFLLRRVGGRVEAAGLVRPRDLGLRRPRGHGPGGLVEVGPRPLCNHRKIQTRPHTLS